MRPWSPCSRGAHATDLSTTDRAKIALSSPPLDASENAKCQSLQSIESRNNLGSPVLESFGGRSLRNPGGYKLAWLLCRVVVTHGEGHAPKSSNASRFIAGRFFQTGEIWTGLALREDRKCRSIGIGHLQLIGTSFVF